MSVGRNTIANVIGAVAPTVVLLFTVPRYLGQLGETRYGVLSLLWLTLGYFSFMDVGFSRATASEMSRRHSPETRAEAFWTAVTLNAMLGTVIGALVLLLGPIFLRHAGFSYSELRDEVADSLPWIAATVPVAMSSSVMSGTLEGRQRFMLVNTFQVCAGALTQILPLAAIAIWGGSLTIVIASTLMTRAATSVVLGIICIRAENVGWTPRVSLASTKAILGYGAWVGLGGLLGTVMETADRMVLGVVIGAKSVAFYSIGYQLATKPRVLPISFVRALFPRLCAAGEEAVELSRSGIMVMTQLLTPVFLCCILLLGPFLRLWIGDEASSHVAPIAFILLAGVWLNSLAQLPLGLLQARGRPGVAARLQALETLPFLVALYFAACVFGSFGAACAWTIRVTVDAVLLTAFAGLGHRTISRLLEPATMMAAATAISVVEMRDMLRLGAWVVILSWLAAWLYRSRAFTRLSIESTSTGTVLERRCDSGEFPKNTDSDARIKGRQQSFTIDKG